ncbi:VapC toxin family PIN domain ribonuclease [candidate division WWE3 bacterium CG10_big_fil_rev_8_21_14_0_10_32_10]|uniref:Ribonuclease VapC n=1 Tax=candidate division WWE3 bacterium CG10_big_fil_rev_8_21_14_0_10_32_10 TaxID=1975090 RepID=A0A2H0RDP5_UNCKA|nr:MAG: VapC toxin family PIN domain ribonuclease [candidate division WWE3 bacterium CG10_big_fil_rev_8_21_14_0_10_32_10]
MENKILADTSVLIDLQRAKKETVKKFKYNKDSICISRITACEFIYGSRNKKEKKLNKEFIEFLLILEITAEVSELAYILLDKYSLKFNLGIADSLIASTALYNGLKLWTLNKKHFERIKELDLF